MILVTGATGQIGSLVLQQLLESDVPVRAFVRDEKRVEQLDHPSLEVAVGTFEDKDSLEKAVKGMDSIFLVARDNPDQVQQHENVIRAAEQNGVRNIVKLSAFTASKDSPISLMRWHAETEEMLKNSTLDWTFIRPQLYMQNLLRSGESVAKEGVLTAPMDNDAFALIDVRDIAEAAAEILKSKGHVSKIYTLTGPSPTTYTQIAETLSEVLDKPVSYSAVPPEEFYDALKKEGKPAWRAYDLAYIADAYYGDKNTFVTDDIEALLGRKARNIKTFLNDNISTFQ